MKLFDTELIVMDILWHEGDITARVLTQTLTEQEGWAKTTCYSVIKQCVKKGIIARLEPGYICHPLITKQEAQMSATEGLLQKMFGNNEYQMISFILNMKRLSVVDLEQIASVFDSL